MLPMQVTTVTLVQSRSHIFNISDESFVFSFEFSYLTVRLMKIIRHRTLSPLRFQGLTAASMESSSSVFWDVAPCSLVEVYRRFRGVYCLHHQGDHHIEFVDDIIPSFTTVSQYL
jgi:hypothetical protein